MSEQIDAKELDVIVIGAGPAGGQCARELAKMGRRVVLLEHSQEIGQPNYSTAGTPKETIEEFDLPDSILSASWDRIYLESTNAKVEWKFPQTRGYVFDFAALRKFLAEDAAQHGADIMVGAAATALLEEGGKYVGVKYKGILGDGELRAPIIVDATGHWGFVNSQLHLNTLPSQDLASAMELQMSGIPQGLEKTIAFYFGKVAPQGYAWVFPMEQDRASKVGIGILGPLPAGLEMKSLLKDFIKKFKNTEHLEPIEIHGGGGYISPGIRDHVIKNIIMIGDSAYQANALAFEGIRHALRSGSLATAAINETFNNKLDLSKLKELYESSWRKIFGKKWAASYKISETIYHSFTDKDWDKVVTAYNDLSPEDAYEIFFNYRYEKVLKSPKLALVLGKYIIKSTFI